MNFSSFFLKSFRVLLLPFALLYGLIIMVRNWLYDKEYLQSSGFNFPLICVGNIAVGGTGKSPMVEYLLKLLTDDYRVATLSRGYKRKTKGYILAEKGTTALDIGDEPMQFFLKYPNVSVAVGEERIVAIPQMLHDNPDLQAIILDDAFQHREVKAGFNIVLTEFSNLYYHDFFLPTGDLRDEWRSAKRANIIVITKCPPDLSEDKKQKIIRNLKLLPFQKVFFTKIEYGVPYHIIAPDRERYLNANMEVMLVCGIANPKPLKEYLINNVSTYYQKDYNDHHIFSIDDLNEVIAMFREIQSEDKIILTTEKDAVRLTKFREELKELPFYVLPIRHKFLFEEGEQFNKAVISFIRNFRINPEL
jgi:tetraacyldisaccharide 4'-kinase